ncbi:MULTISPECIES: rhomboid family intramembrane serine protease [unclassified Beijerinckia]|uniref:rhomboid family intramembrane serine protease n=1 Tax=unclassified Beijerinckia TaxID=2638183 RepID=UPI000895A892|nr:MULTISPECIES: rhomboid family intramembrane serine protease [unclassified Beijerinckia]MDH7798067.1 membrane associated rhomboid family serine protease [Beijerinckia sp. GAS462]SED07790.1 Membrane associated serine protease, rhomboid family [Beijerinckia sp. 28-YEA-48]
MFIPLYDGVALRYLKRPIATYSLLALNVFVYLTIATGLLGSPQTIGLKLGMIPAVIFGSAVVDPAIAHVPAWATLLTSMFVHGGFLHLTGNMLFLWVFGDNVEDAMGSLRFTAFYLLSGVAGALLYAALEQQSQAPLIGASAAVSGVVAAYVLLYPRVHVFVLAFAWLPLSITALYIILAWIVVQFGSALFSSDTETGWWAHVGGLIAGAALTPLLRRPEVPLFGKRTA